MNLTVDQKIQIAVARTDMALATVGRVLRLALPVVGLTVMAIIIIRLLRERHR